MSYPAYSIWLMPDQESSASIKQLIDPLSLKYHSHSFEPHITLLSRIGKSEGYVRDRVKDLSKVIHPFEIELKEIEYNTTYFQCVLAQIKPTLELMEARVLAQDLLEADKTMFYNPHLSLLYGDFVLEEREKISRQITLPIHTLRIEKIWMTPSGVRPEQWVTLEEFVLTP